MTEILAAGGVLWRPAPSRGGLEIAVIHRPKYDDWSLPKGKVDPGETLLEAAVREVLEETGHRGVVGVHLGMVSYLKANRAGAYRDKIVHYWEMREAGGRFTAGKEVDDLRWVTTGAAERLVSYAMDVEIIGRFTWSLAPARA